MNVWQLATLPAVGLATSLLDNYLFETVRPAVGSLVYCDIYLWEHSGIVIADDAIVHLNGDGCIEVVSYAQFLRRLEGWNNAMSIYASSVKNQAGEVYSVGSERAAERAIEMIGQRWDYHLWRNNCHRFSHYCLSGQNSDVTFFTELKFKAEKLLQANTWRVVERS